MNKISAGICIAIFGMVLSGCKDAKINSNQAENVRPIRTMVIQQPDVLEKGSIAGRSRAVQSVDLSFRVGGPLVQRPANIGDIVTQGELIAQIDPTDYESEVLRAQGGFEQARAALARAEGDYRRETSIFKEDPGATSEAFIDLKQEALSRAKANVKSAQAALITAQNHLGYTELKSPISGKIVATYVENYETVQPKQRIVRILNNSQIKFDVDVPSQLISYLDFIVDIFVEFDDLPNLKIPATLYEVATEASQATRTFRVTLLLEQPQEREILAGMSGNASFTLDRSNKHSHRIIKIPSSAVFSPDLGEKSFVWIVGEDMLVKKREVTISRISEQGVEITHGINPGETIAIAGVHFLKEGTKVRLIDTPQSS